MFLRSYNILLENWLDMFNRIKNYIFFARVRIYFIFFPLFLLFISMLISFTFIRWNWQAAVIRNYELQNNTGIGSQNYRINKLHIISLAHANAVLLTKCSDTFGLFRGKLRLKVSKVFKLSLCFILHFFSDILIAS